MTLASAKSIGAGIGGALILTLFFSTFLTLEKAVFLLPLFMAFTGAMIGYQLTESLKDRMQARFAFPFVMGAAQGAVVFVIARISLPMAGSLIVLTGVDLLLYIFVSGITSILGARLAARYFNL